MENNFNAFEATLLLEAMATKRSKRLSQIATDRLLQGLGWPGDDKTTIAIEHDNIVTDVEMRLHFLKRGVASSDASQAHTNTCVEGTVAYCICTPEKRLYDTEIPF